MQDRSRDADIGNGCVSNKLFSFFVCFFFFIINLFNWRLITLQYCIGFAKQIIFRIKYVHGYSTLNRLQYSINKIFICTGKPKNTMWWSILSIYFITVIWNKTHNFSKVCPYFEYAIPSSLGLKVSDEKLCYGKFSCILLLYFLLLLLWFFLCLWLLTV